MVEDKAHSKLHTLLVVCAWCKTHIGKKKVSYTPLMDTTHGMCDKCFDEELQRLDEDLDGQDGRNQT